MSNKQMAETLADKAVASVKKAGVREDILAVLLKAAENNFREAVVEVLLIAMGHAIAERDKEWLRELAGPWAPKSGLRTATNPAEVERDIREWHAAGVAETRQVAYRAGYEDAFPAALRQGVKLGWATHEAGKDLEAALKAAEKIRPS